jgi:hypothetical protein
MTLNNIKDNDSRIKIDCSIFEPLNKLFKTYVVYVIFGYDEKILLLENIPSCMDHDPDLSRYCIKNGASFAIGCVDSWRSSYYYSDRIIPYDTILTLVRTVDTIKKFYSPYLDLMDTIEGKNIDCDDEDLCESIFGSKCEGTLFLKYLQLYTHNIPEKDEDSEENSDEDSEENSDEDSEENSDEDPEKDL